MTLGEDPDSVGEFEWLCLYGFLFWSSCRWVLEQ